MRKLLFLAALLLTTQVWGQTLQMNNRKCDGVTQVKIMQYQQAKDNPEVRLIAKVTKQFDPQAFKRQGIVVGAKAGDIVTLRLSANNLYLLDQMPEVLHYTVSEPVQPTLNRTRLDTHTDSVHEGLGGLPQAYTGKDVIIGITDWGFDYKHPNFNNNGQDNRRLLQAWDQFKLSGPAPEGFDYGTVFTNRHDLLQAQGDTAGLYGYATHGTHVAGISAGRGIDGNYTGQAPYANLLFASFHLDLASWMDAVQWMYNVAKEEGKRLVVNNSWGMYTLGPIDGTSLASQAINNWTDSGVVFVVSAGNNGNVPSHLKKTFNSRHDTVRTICSYYSFTAATGVNITFWGEPNKEFQISFAMVSETDSLCFRWVNTRQGDFYLDSALVLGNDSLTFRITVEQSNIFNQRPHVLLNIDNSTKYDIHLAATATEGTIHAWTMACLENGAGNMGTLFDHHGWKPGYVAGDNNYTIGEPACAEGCIAVAAHNADGRKPDGTINTGYRAYFSSIGPTLDERNKPEISAPGIDVCSSISSYTTEEYPSTMTYTYAGRQYIWAKMSGTSMSCPAVTGIVALMLEANPELTPSAVKKILCRTARNDDKTGALHDNDSISDEWGWGKADALAAVNEALAYVDIAHADADWFAKSLQVYPNPATDRVTILTGRHESQRVMVYNINGSLVMQQNIVMEGTMDISQLPHGVYIVKAGARTARLVK